VENVPVPANLSPASRHKTRPGRPQTPRVQCHTVRVAFLAGAARRRRQSGPRPHWMYAV